MTYFIIFIILIVLYFIYRYNLLMPSVEGVPVLMYHKFSEEKKDRLTVTIEQFRDHLNYIKNNNYTPISFRDLDDHIENNKPLPSKPVIITFDDGYLNNYKFAYPLLIEYNFKATIFLVASCIGKKNEWDEGEEDILDFSHIKEMSENNIEFGLHTFNHENLKEKNLDDIEEDIEKSVEVLERGSPSINLFKVIAYPYGSLPEELEVVREMESLFKKYNIKFGLLIKSRINRMPVVDRYRLTRVNVKGTDSFFEFKIKLRKGRTKMF